MNLTTTHSLIRSARLRLGLSGQELASRAGISLGWLYLCEKSPQLLRLHTARRIARVLGVEVGDIFPEAQP